MKKMISLIVTLALMLSLAVPTMATLSEPSNHGSITMEIEGEEITFMSYEIDGVVYVSYQEDGVEHLVSHDARTGMLVLDDMAPEFVSPYALSDGGWYPVYGGVTESDFVTDINDASTVASVVAKLIAFVGGAGLVALVPSGQEILTSIGNTIIAEGLPTIYYRQTQYYKLVNGSSRPNLGYTYEFFADEEMEDSMGFFDACV